MDLPGLPSWDRSAAEELISAVVALRGELAAVEAELRWSSSVAQDGWVGPDRDRFDTQLAEVQRLLGDLQADSEPVAAIVQAAEEAYFQRRRLLADTLGVGPVHDAATWMGW